MKYLICPQMTNFNFPFYRGKKKSCEGFFFFKLITISVWFFFFLLPVQRKICDLQSSKNNKLK